MFKKTLLALAATAALASAIPAQAASFYLTIPLNSRSTAPVAEVSVNLANGTLADAMVGEPYSATVKNYLAVTGDEGFNLNRVGWGVSTGVLPAGLNFNVTTGAISGTPTAPGANTFVCLSTATYRGKADEGMFNLSVMEILLALQNNTLPAGTIGAPYSAGLQNFLTVTGDAAFNGSNVGWSFTSGSLPAGLVLNAETGAITGTPTGPSSTPFVVSATYRGKTASGTYSVSVLDITVNLAAATLPAARVNTAYSTDLANNLTVANDAIYIPGTTPVTWTLSSGTLPPGLTLSADGKIEGSPTTVNKSGASFEILATHLEKSGIQTYTISVSGVILKVTSISPGGKHTCAIDLSGAAWCWGSNSAGQLGGHQGSSSYTPVSVSGLSGVTNISLGWDHSCAVTSAGSAFCWGSRNYGKLGTTGPGGTTSAPTPEPVIGLQTGVASIYTGDFHSCALKTTGAVVCWGSNTQGALGDNSATSRDTPVAVVGLGSGVAQLALGARHSCARLTTGAVRCWGLNEFGQLGDRTLVTKRVPTAVYGLGSGISSIAAGDAHTCAVTSSGKAQCWGEGQSGQVGDGTATRSLEPKAVTGLTSGVQSISAGATHTCAIHNGSVKCWGENSEGQLGNQNTTSQVSPVSVSGLSGVSSVAAGATHTCAVTTAGDLKCWGDNSYGQLGTGDTVNRLTPTAIE